MVIEISYVGHGGRRYTAVPPPEIAAFRTRSKPATQRLAGAPQTVAARGGTASNVAVTWATRTANISTWASQTIQLGAEALDANLGSLIDSGSDNVTIIRQ